MTGIGDSGVAYFSPLKLRPFLEVARESGVDVAAILAAQGTTQQEMLDPEARLPRLQCVAIVRALIAPLHDPLIGLRAAERSQLEDIDVLGYLARQCPNALAALEKLRNFTRLVGDASEVTLEHAPGRVIIRLGLSGGRSSIAELADFGVASIAQRLGFSDATAFGRAFRRWQGVSPSQYRARPAV